VNSLSLDTKWKATKPEAKDLMIEVGKNLIGGILPMANISNRDIKRETTRIAVIFLLTGLLLGSGFVLCILDFVAMDSITMRLFGSLAIGASVLSSIVAAIVLSSNVLCHRLLWRI